MPTQWGWEIKLCKIETNNMKKVNERCGCNEIEGKGKRKMLQRYKGTKNNKEIEKGRISHEEFFYKHIG